MTVALADNGRPGVSQPGKFFFFFSAVIQPVKGVSQRYRNGGFADGRRLAVRPREVWWVDGERRGDGLAAELRGLMSGWCDFSGLVFSSLRRRQIVGQGLDQANNRQRAQKYDAEPTGSAETADEEQMRRDSSEGRNIFCLRGRQQ